MLLEFLEKAVGLNADSLEVGYENGTEWITAFRGDVGVGIGSVDSTDREALLEELRALKKSKRATVLGKEYRLSFSSHDSLGETVYQMRWKREDPTRLSPRSQTTEQLVTPSLRPSPFRHFVSQEALMPFKIVCKC